MKPDMIIMEYMIGEIQLRRMPQKNYTVLWAVVCKGLVYHKGIKGFALEQLPSNRDQEWLDNTRFDLDTAKQIAMNFYSYLKEGETVWDCANRLNRLEGVDLLERD